MSNSVDAYHFLPWVRWGAAVRVTAPTLGKASTPATASMPNRVPVPFTVLINGIPLTGSPPLSLYGPGDVIGIDSREVVRAEPRNQTTGFPPHLFPFVEFDRPDFPWLFTPGAPDQEGCLRPWIVLVVVNKSAVTISPGRPLPVLSCPDSELPDLDDSWAWAHTQYTGSVGSNGIEGALLELPDQNVSRLLCARRLQPGRGYHACLVPAFKAGLRAGLGEAEQDGDNVHWHAWESGGGREVRIPVYYHWEFTTGREEDFKQLVQRLCRRPSQSQLRVMEVSWPSAAEPSGWSVAKLPLASALYVPAKIDGGATATVEIAQTAPPGLRDHLRTYLPPSVDTLSPPIYGSWQVSRTGTAAVDGPPGWIPDLNLEPTYRVAAALGAQVVQHHQEQLIAAAWDQVADLKAVHQWLRQKQLGRAVTASTYDMFQPALMPDAAFWRITAPVPVPTSAKRGAALGRGPGLEGQRLHDATLGGSFRRMVRPLGALGRRLGAAQGEAVRNRPGDAVAHRSTRAARDRVNFLDAVVPPLGATVGAVVVSGHPWDVPDASPVPPDRDKRYAALNPWSTFGNEAPGRVEMPVWDSQDPLRPTPVALSFRQPMYEALRDLFPDSLLPGLDKIPNNSLVVLKADAKFIEAFMVGLNHEMSRELLWHEFPADLQGTYFAQFWGTAGSESSDADLPPIGSWQRALGANLTAARGDELYMLLIRGELLERYPDALIYAVRAAWSNAQLTIPDDASIKHPAFRIEPVSGVTLLAFALDPHPTEEATCGPPSPGSDPGWFFVIEEHPTETRFGLEPALDGARPQGEKVTWRNLAWSDLKAAPDITGASQSGYISVARGLKDDPSDSDTAWGANSAHMAYITLRQRYRLRIHSSTWFKQDQVAENPGGGG